MNCSVTSQDLRDARRHYGPCVRCLAGKMTIAPSPISTSAPPPHVGHTLHADIVYVRGEGGHKLPYLFTVESITSYIIVAKLRNKARPAVADALSKVIARYRSYGRIVHILRTDREVIFDAVERDINNLGVQLKRTSPDRHEKKSERAVRTIRERMRATLGGLSYRLPGRLYNHLLTHVVSSLNVVPNDCTAGRAPREIVCGEKINAAISLDQPFGAMAMFKTPKDTAAEHLDHLDRSELGIIIGRDFNSC